MAGGRRKRICDTKTYILGIRDFVVLSGILGSFSALSQMGYNSKNACNSKMADRRVKQIAI